MMNKHEISLNWKTGNPIYEGLYFVAVKYGDGAGIFEFLTWDKNSWGFENEGIVVAYVDIQNFKNSINIAWPDGGHDLSKKYKREENKKSEPWKKA